MRHARHVIAVTLMATAICADRVSPAAPAQPPAACLAGRLIARLSVNLRRAVPAAQLYQPRRATLRPALAGPPALADQTAMFQLQPASPFQFRLPPPAA